jgi:hypothetical protein
MAYEMAVVSATAPICISYQVDILYLTHLGGGSGGIREEANQKFVSDRLLSSEH